MSAKRSINYQLIDLSLKDIFPQCKSPQDQDIFQELFAQVLPNFADKVEFVLAEILELQRYESKATTHIYSGFGPEKNAQLIADYFNIINRIIDERGWSLSKLDNLYFGQRIWCAHLHSDDVAPGLTSKHAPKEWYKTDEKLPMNYAEKQERQEKEVEEVFQHYLRELNKLCLNQYAHSYVLLIPISLNALEDPRQYKAKLGAIFLHFSSCDELGKQELRRLYSQILLFWHYHFTSESVSNRLSEIEHHQREIEQHQREIKQLKAVQELFTSVQQYTNEIRDTLEKLQKPFMGLEMTLSPVCGLIYGGQSLDPFFQNAGPAIPINNHLIKPAHAWKAGVANNPAELKKYQDLTAAIIFKALGLADSIDSTPTLWEQLCTQLNQGVSGPKQSLVAALVEYIPALGKENPEPQEIENTFNTVKAWFNDAYKAQDKDDASLPYSFLAMALKSMNCKINFPLFSNDSAVRSQGFWVASKHPIETLDALAVLHDMSIIKEAALTIPERGTHRLEIWMEEPHKMNESDALKLENNLRNTLDNIDFGGRSRRGNMVYVFLKLFGSRRINREGMVFSLEEGRRRLSVEFGGDDKDKITIEWVGGRVFS